MKINLIVILSIIFYTTALLGSGKEQIVKKVVSYTKEQKTPSTEYILNTFEDRRLKVDEDVLARFKNKPEKIKTYEQYKKIFFNKQRIDGGVSFYKKNKTLLSKVAREFEIDPIVLVAIIGVETNYGSKVSEFSVINSLYTQAMKMPKRSNWATKEMNWDDCFRFARNCFFNLIYVNQKSISFNIYKNWLRPNTTYSFSSCEK